MGAGEQRAVVDVDEETKALLIPRFNISGGAAAGLIDPRTGDIAPPKLYSLGAQPYAWHVAPGTKILINPACLSGAGATKVPIELISDGYVWRPCGEQILYYVPGSFAAPAFIVPAQASKVEASFLAGAGGNPLIPFGFMYLGLGIRVRGNFIKNDADANAALFRIALGRFNSLGNDIIWQVQTGSVAGHEIPADRTAFVTKLGAYGTAVYTTMGAAKLHTAATQATDSSADRNTSFTTTADNYCVFSAVPNNTLNVASASAALINFSISLVAA